MCITYYIDQQTLESIGIQQLIRTVPGATSVHINRMAAYHPPDQAVTNIPATICTRFVVFCADYLLCGGGDGNSSCPNSAITYGSRESFHGGVYGVPTTAYMTYGSIRVGYSQMPSPVASTPSSAQADQDSPCSTGQCETPAMDYAHGSHVDPYVFGGLSFKNHMGSNIDATQPLVDDLGLMSEYVMNNRGFVANSSAPHPLPAEGGNAQQRSQGIRGYGSLSQPGLKQKRAPSSHDGLSKIGDPNKKKSHICRTCGKAFCNPSSLSRHKDIHRRRGAKPHQCPQCLKGYSRLDAMKRHVEETHGGKRRAKSPRRHRMND